MLDLILVIVLCMPGQTLPLQDNDCPEGCCKARAANFAAKMLGVMPDVDILGRNQQPLTRADTDVLHYNLDIEIDPGAQWIGGSNTMTVESLVNGLTLFPFRLSSTFTITALTVNGSAAAWTRVDSATLEVTLDRTYNTGEQFQLFVAYDGNPVGGGFGSIQFTTQSGQPIVWTLSEAWYAYTWWPAKDDNRDKATADLRFTVPDSMVVASNGTLQSVTPLPGSKHRYYWKTEYQTATYLYAFTATNYNFYTDTFHFPGGSMPVEMYIFPSSDTSSNRNEWWKMVDMLGVFSNLYGLYPFTNEKYGMAQFGWGGGMEHQTITFQSGFWESVTAHELGHQWWGDTVTCATWHDIWLNEGFATYSEALWFEFETGVSNPTALHNHMDSRRPSDVNGTVYCYDISSMSRIFSTNFSYRKPAWVLHQLRHVVGDDTFFDILAAYRTAFEYGSATTAEFQDVAENVADRDLDWFFDPWVYDVGAPKYRYGWTPHTVGGQDYVELYVSQVQSSSYPVFPMPIDIETVTGGGTTTHVVWNDAKTEHLLFAVDGPVNQLDFDPDEWILREGLSTTSFVPGPPKIVATTPQPGAVLRRGETGLIEIAFHKDVAAAASDFAITGMYGGAQPFSFSYDSQTFTATLLPAVFLPFDIYTLTIDDNIVGIQSGNALDGELKNPAAPKGLPSGDGLAGGDGKIVFAVLPSGNQFPGTSVPGGPVGGSGPAR
jgi:aminopeptidase N